MSKESVKKFNTLCGNAPSQGDLWEVWKQLRLQGDLIREEGLEVSEATQVEDMENLIKEYADAKYVLLGLESLLEAFGVNTSAAFDDVCSNNLSKTTTSFTYANESKSELEDKGVQCYIETTGYQGETYYTVRDLNGKVRKLKHYEKCDMSKYVPEEFK